MGKIKDLMKGKKEFEEVETQPTIDSGDVPDVINADLGTKRETKEVVVKDVSSELVSLRAEIAQTFATSEDVGEEIMRIHERIDQVITHIKSKEQPNL